MSLHKAAIEGDTSAVGRLIAAGADVNARESVHGHTPLHGAVYYGHKETVRRLIASGADVNIPDSPNAHTPLHFAVSRGHREIVEDLIAAGAYSDDAGHLFRGKPASCRSEATAGMNLVP